MPNVDGLCFIIQKHITVKRKSGNFRTRRRFHQLGDLPTVRELAKKYALQNKVDFIICQVIEEVSKPEGAADENAKDSKEVGNYDR
jgi:hypothetical protein